MTFTARHLVAAPLDDGEVVAALDPDDIAAPFNPAFLAWLGRRLSAAVGHVDVTLARLGTGAGDGWLEPLADPPDSERVRRAHRIRRDVELLAPPGGGSLVTLGTGLAGRRELSMEVTEERCRDRGLGTRLVRAAVDRTPADVALFAAVAPGNARSLRCLLAAGFTPIGAECLLT